MFKGLAVAALSVIPIPGLAQGLTSQRRAAIAWIALFTLALVSITFSPLGVFALLAVYLASIIHAFVSVPRVAQPVRWDWLLPTLSLTITIVVALGARVFLFEAFKIPSSSMYPTLQIGDHVFINKLARSADRGDVIVFRQPCEPDRDYVKRVVAVAEDTVEIRCNVVYVNGKALANELLDANCTYRDYDEMRDDWNERKCSRYRETNDGHAYEVFHDPDRPGRDGDQNSSLVRTSGDVKDFPQDNIVRSCMNNLDTNRPANQKPGKLVQTKPDSSNPCELHLHYVVPAGHLFVLGDNRANANDSRYWGSVPIENVKGRVTGIWKPWARAGSIE